MYMFVDPIRFTIDMLEDWVKRKDKDKEDNKISKDCIDVEYTETYINE